MKPITLPHYKTGSVSAVVLSLLCSATIAFGQLQWSSYDTSGNLLNANVATGGDVASGSVTFTVPANTRMFFITRSFTPIVLSQANCFGGGDVQIFRFGRNYRRGAKDGGVGFVQLYGDGQSG